MRNFWVLLIALTSSTLLHAGQRYVDPTNTYHRVYAIVPVVSAATETSVSVSRPKHAPLPAQIGATTRILGFSSQISDNGNYALIEIVAIDRAALQNVLSDNSIQVWEKGVSNLAAMESAFRLLKKNFSLSKFDEVRVK
ncbi:hypothetical protein [Nevskia soli]|jgi:hypothetical protein|uniref:hypothetical protein n=1 Tax=Nevskia soli TaxID=418856 RepID=UPI0015D7007F|nr:hypothetical protein [Nevskia soli]